MATKKAAAKKTSSSYNGQSWSDIQAMTDAEIDKAFSRLGVVPHKFLWHDDDGGWSIAAHGTRPLDDLKDWTPAEIATLKTEAFTKYRTSLRHTLLASYIEAWVAPLSDEKCWTVLGDLEDVKPSVSERRYTDRITLKARVVGAVYASGMKENHATTTTTKEEPVK